VADLSEIKLPDLPFRPCVGIMMLNRFGQVWLGRRTPKWIGDKSTCIWQMPQGGIGKNELPAAAALRELEEETNARSVEIIGELPEWLSYELPDDLLGVALKGRYRGQKQKWFATRFVGFDSEINIGPKKGIKAEFDAWRWSTLDEVISLSISFKRPVYEVVVREFESLAMAGQAHLAQTHTGTPVQLG
jgi:putative (di)nucleoside polyphosphate hydrolase